MPERRTDNPGEHLIRQAKAGDETAITEIVNKYQAYLMFIANQEIDNSLAGRVAPSDAVQDTLVGLRQKLGLFRGSTESELKAWLRSSLRNVIRNAHRDHNRLKRSVVNEVELPTDGAEDSETPSRRIRTAEERLAVEQSLSKLSARDQEILRLRHEEGLTFVEIGRTNGVSADAARMSWMRAIERIKDHLAASGEISVD